MSSPTLLHLLSIYPISSLLIPCLRKWDLISLSRTNTSFRAFFHGLDPPPSSQTLTKGVRPALFIDVATTPKWIESYSECRIWCAELYHPTGFGATRGADIRPCRLCSRPICRDCQTVSRDQSSRKDILRYCTQENIEIMTTKLKVLRVGSTLLPNLVHSQEFYRHHYIALCPRCCAASMQRTWQRITNKPYHISMSNAWAQTPKTLFHSRRSTYECRCDWPVDNALRVCLDCRVRMYQDREKGLLLRKEDAVPTTCARVGCEISLMGWERPWGRKGTVVCVLCGLPRKAARPLLR